MMDDALGPIDYDEAGAGPAILFVPGSCSTGAAWKAVITRLGDRFRTITTSLPGYGGTAERRSGSDRSISLVASAIEAVIRHAGEPVHLVGHSFGGEAGLAVALRGIAPLESLVILEAPAPGMLATFDKPGLYAEFRTMTSAYIADFHSGNAEAIAAVIDFYGGVGTFASWPPAIRAYAMATTATNILDWDSAYKSHPSPEVLAALDLPVLVAVGQHSHPAVIEANALIAGAIPRAAFETIAGADHFMIATHPDAVAALIVAHVSAGRPG